MRLILCLMKEQGDFITYRNVKASTVAEDAELMIWLVFLQIPHRSAVQITKLFLGKPSLLLQNGLGNIELIKVVGKQRDCRNYRPRATMLGPEG